MEVVFNEGEGTYSVKIDLKIKIENKSVEILNSNVAAKRDFDNLKDIPEVFLNIIYQSSTRITYPQAAKIYETIRKSEKNGATARDIMRAANIKLDDLYSCLKDLHDFGWVRAYQTQTNGKGRPKIVYVLIEYAKSLGLVDS